MKNRNRTVFSKLIAKGLLLIAERLLGGIPVIGSLFRVAVFVFA